MNVHDVYRVFQTYFRKPRMRQFADLLDVRSNMKIIDVGGYRDNWLYISQEPEVLLLNLEDESFSDGRFTKAKGDGRDLKFGDNAFDVAYSNSVIEHVGHWPDMVAFACELRRVAPRYYVQTPNKWFFIEPHLIAPCIHWLPRKYLKAALPFFSIWYWIERPSPEQVDAFLDNIELIDKKAMIELFPDAEIFEERFLGLTKSIIAVRR